MSAVDGRSTPGLTWTVDRQPALTTVKLRGELDLASAPVLQSDLDEAIATAPVTVLDLEELAFMDSTGLRMFARLNQAAKERGVRLLVGRPSPAVLRILDVAGLVEHFDYAEGGPPRERVCPVCEEWIPGTQTRCLHCGSSI